MIERSTVPLARRVDRVDETMIRTMYDLAEQRSGDLVRLEIGEPDFDTPEHIVEAAAEAARGGATHYTHNAGIPALREAIAEKMERDHDLAVDPNQVVAAAGATEALYLTLLTTAERGDEVVLPTPAWPQYRLQIQLAGATPVEVGLSAADDFDLDVDRVVDAIGDDTACVILNSPSNPTSQVYDPEAVEAVVDAAAAHDAVVVLDEVYASLDFGGDGRSLAADLDANNVVVINACSKQYAMTGWRLGWLVAPEHLARGAIKLHPGTSSCPSSLSQHGAVAALTGPQDEAEAMFEAFRERRDYVRERVDSIPSVSCPAPDGGFYAFLDVSALEGTSFEIAERLLEEHGVVTVPGEGFGAGGQGSIRVSFASSLAELEEGFDRIERFVRDELA
ncbi:aminotransferase class I/II-fold pyridoxal phosphate-dependent enzyme [Haloprofundus halophilus]|uniref:aminotransferase class I/II-fold pyridoxal phosphate-dependent enzyme n=1 Tax=Haloprofundus halophilus TaxID=2283527 RepID=UPI000E42E2C7|nr:aminotransferase class I/II-fold pyridoxal phosphate-dependent enzyme [Haloprofundus halophilus]